MNIKCNLNDELWLAVTAGHEAQLRAGGFSLGDSKPAAIITSERYHDLWQAVMAKCGELEQQHKPNRGTSRSAAMIDSDGRGISATIGVGQDDGTDVVYFIRARTTPRGGISVGHDGPWLDSHDRFWNEQASDRSNAVVIGHTHYRIKPDLASSRADCAGYGGQFHRIRMLADGKVIETRNLWYQGVVPPSWRDRLPDDAEFVTAATPKLSEQVTA